VLSRRLSTCTPYISFPYYCGSSRNPIYSYCGIVECACLSFTASRIAMLLSQVPRIINFFGLDIDSVSHGLDTTRCT
jgi:hypothetical protein